MPKQAGCWCRTSPSSRLISSHLVVPRLESSWVGGAGARATFQPAWRSTSRALAPRTACSPSNACSTETRFHPLITFLLWCDRHRVPFLAAPHPPLTLPVPTLPTRSPFRMQASRTGWCTSATTPSRRNRTKERDGVTARASVVPAQQRRRHQQQRRVGSTKEAEVAMVAMVAMAVVERYPPGRGETCGPPISSVAISENVSRWR